MSKVLILNGSPRVNGNTSIAIREMENVFRNSGVEVTTIQIGNKDIRGCIACNQCSKIGKCVFDDIVNELAPLFEAADGLVIASPVYYASANATLIACIHGCEKGEAEMDEEGKQTMRMLAKNMTFLMKSIELGKKEYGLPEQEERTATNFIR